MGAAFPISIIWWLVVAAVGTWVLMRTKFGNWIFAVGGHAIAARMVGVPVDRVTISLFITTAVAPWLVALIEATNSRSADVLRGVQREFYADPAPAVTSIRVSGFAFEDLLIEIEAFAVCRD